VGGQPVVAEAIHSPDYLPDVSSLLPAIEDEAKPAQLWHAPASSLWSALESLFGQPKYEHADDLAKTLPAFAAGARKGLALGPNAPQFDEGLYGEDEPTQPRRHHKHGNCFWRRFSKGFLFISSALAYAFTQTLPGLLLLNAGLLALAFHVVRRLKHRRQARHEALPQYDADLPPCCEFHNEKPPTYVEPVPQTNLTIFDAEATDEKA
jgi:hypothetical protein